MGFNVSDFLSETEKVTKILAILLAGGWAYYHYFRGRTYRPRLELSVSGDFAASDTVDHMIATVKLKNVGLSRLVLEQRGSALVVSICGGIVEPITRTKWSAKGAFPIFEHHGWIEPGETIQNKVLFGVPKDQIAVMLEFRINAAGIKWVADDIVSCATASTNTTNHTTNQLGR